jgi:signal transduction histidine kinase
MRIGLRSKFLVLTSILLLAIFGAITYTQIQTSTQELRANLFEESKAFASLATEPIGNVYAIYKDSGLLKIDQQTDEFAVLNTNISNISIVDYTGKTVYSQDENSQVNISPEDAQSFDPIYKYADNETLETIIYPYFEASGAHRYSVVYSVSDDEIESAVRHEATQLLYFGLASLIVTMLLVYMLINVFIIRPVEQLSEQAMVISAGNLEQQIQIHGRDEIASLGESVNKMAESLKANIAELQEVDKVKSEFMMITSHNLRTPLTIISGYLDNIDEIIGDTEKIMTALNRISASVKRLEIFAEDVLTISRFELGDAKIQADKVKLSEFMERIINEFQTVVTSKNIELSTDIQDGDTDLQISIPYIRSAVWNILDNAVKFTKEGGTIKLITKKNGESVDISISDNGIGISEDELPKLFTKFHRGTSTLTYDFEGTGIGLYASKVMVEKHGGTVSASSKLGEGSTFTIHLPLSGAINTHDKS